MALSYELNLAEIIGFIGGIVLAVALAPQVSLVLKTRSTKDISYSWQLIYIFGLILNYVYFVMVHATAAWVTLTVELAFALWLLCLKIKYDGFGSSSSKQDDTVKDSSSDSCCSICSIIDASSNTTIQIAGDVDLDLETGSLRYKDAIRFDKSFTIDGDTLVQDAFRGFHVMIDVVFTKIIDEDFGTTLLAKMCELAKLHGVRVMHDHACIFDGTESPPGFAVGALLDESHMTAHCYSDQGKLAFDVFTCGSDPDCTRRVARDVLAYLKEHLGEDAVFQTHRLPRFPEQ